MNANWYCSSCAHHGPNTNALDLAKYKLKKKVQPWFFFLSPTTKEDHDKNELDEFTKILSPGFPEKRPNHGNYAVESWNDIYNINRRFLSNKYSFGTTWEQIYKQKPCYTKQNFLTGNSSRSAFIIKEEGTKPNIYNYNLGKLCPTTSKLTGLTSSGLAGAWPSFCQPE